MNIFNEFKLKNFNLKNRVVLPPMVRFSLIDESGYVSDGLIDWYEEVAKGEVGMIVLEACCVSPDGKLRENQLGIWDDSFIPGLKKLAKIGKKYSLPILIQIHHAGFKEKISEVSTETIDKIYEDFKKALYRAKECGFDGIELHGAHSYFLSQLSSNVWNTRTDKYGGSLEKRLYFVEKLIKETKELYSDNFILAYRMGGNDPTIEEGIKVAKRLEELAIDLLHVSWGVPLPDIKRREKVLPPSDFPLDWIVYLGCEIKKHVNIPVIAVSMIKEETQANYLVENNLIDLVAVGRAMIARPNWVKWARKKYLNRISAK